MTSRRIFIPSFVVLGVLSALAIYMTAGPRPVVMPSSVERASVAGSQEFTVGQRNKQFSRETMTLNVGDRVTFVNDDTVAHNIFVTDSANKTRNSGVQEPGENATLAFDAPGTYNVECGIHPEMHMTVLVK
jgi:cytochrome c peroxidase